MDTDMFQGNGAVASPFSRASCGCQGRISFLEGTFRKRAAMMLFVGSFSGFLGFAFAFVIGIITEQTTGKEDYKGDPFASGRGYFPSTVSEMVHNPTQPAGKCFFGFSFVGAVLIFFSWYPTQLRNVYIGDDAVLCDCCRVSWVTFRQFVPAPGMMMLSIITTVPAATASETDWFCISLHLTGAAMLFVGYFLSEAHCIGWGPFKQCRDDKLLKENKYAVWQRKVCLTMILFWYSLFCLMQVVLTIGQPFFKPSETDVWGYVPGWKGKQLLNTACWKVKLLKVVSYGSEVICGLALISSHLVIWYHCEERHYDLQDHLDALSNEVLPTNKASRSKGAFGEESEGESSSSSVEAICC